MIQFYLFRLNRIFGALKIPFIFHFRCWPRGVWVIGFLGREAKFEFWTDFLLCGFKRVCGYPQFGLGPFRITFYPRPGVSLMPFGGPDDILFTEEKMDRFNSIRRKRFFYIIPAGEYWRGIAKYHNGELLEESELV